MQPWPLTSRAALLGQGKGRGGAQLLRGFLAAALALAVSAPPALMLSAHIVQKGASSGALLGQLGTDLQVAVVIALSAQGLVGFLAPLAAQVHPRSIRVRAALAACPWNRFVCSSEPHACCFVKPNGPVVLWDLLSLYLLMIHEVDGACKCVTAGQ
jgi:hypothetical protein